MFSEQNPENANIRAKKEGQKISSEKDARSENTEKKNAVNRNENIVENTVKKPENAEKSQVFSDDYPSLLTDYDFYLLNEGKHWQSYEKLGAHFRTVNGVQGVNFAVWAPNAADVSVIGDFNEWNGSANPMRKHLPSGFWEVFIPGLTEGTNYKYQIRNGNYVSERSDPYGFFAEVPPCTASRVVDLDRYEWNDQKWMDERKANDVFWLRAPISVYEVHLGSWRRPLDDPDQYLSYRDSARQLVEYVLKMGYTHIELLPIAEHPLSASWGYQVVGYYSATSRYGNPQDFMYLVDLCHQNGIGVILDWVPAHFPKDGHGLRRFDGTALYEHADPRQGEQKDWGTMIFNYGRNEVRNFLISNALFWLDKYHIDGLRVDAVASMLYLDYSRKYGEWVPNEHGGRENLQAIQFLQEMNEQVHLQHPGTLTIAEESTSWGGVSRPVYAGGLGFSMKWNMGWMNDTLSFHKKDPLYRKFHHDQMTFSFLYAFSENFVLPISHDEVVHGKGTIISNAPGDLWQKFAGARLLYSYMWTHPGKKLLFMGCDFGQWSEWKFDQSLDWHLLENKDTHAGLLKCVADLNRLYRSEKALYQNDFNWSGFQWIDCHNWEESTFAFIRKGAKMSDFLIILANFTPIPRHQHLGVPEPCFYEEIFNSDSAIYGGSGLVNLPGVQAKPTESHSFPASIDITLPPLGVSILKPRRVSSDPSTQGNE